MTLEQTNLHAENLHEVSLLYEMADTCVLCGDGATDCEHLQSDLCNRASVAQKHHSDRTIPACKSSLL